MPLVHPERGAHLRVDERVLVHERRDRDRAGRPGDEHRHQSRPASRSEHDEHQHRHSGGNERAA